MSTFRAFSPLSFGPRAVPRPYNFQLGTKVVAIFLALYACSIYCSDPGPQELPQELPRQTRLRSALPTTEEA